MTETPAIRRRRGRVPSAAEQALWRFAMRDATPLPGRGPGLVLPPAPVPPESTAPPELPARPAPVRTPALPIALPLLTPTRAPGLDARSAERLERGQLPIEGKLDLHGMTQEDARAALDHFVADAYAAGKRAVLIITGKGLKPRTESGDPWRHQVGGVLKAMTPRWLNEAPNRARVLAFTQAQPRHGGAGAIYVLIRRHRA
jgi:DNA-nicking Smr family endonuclease